MLSGLTLGDRSALEQEHLAAARALQEERKEKRKKQKREKHKKQKEEKHKKRHKEKRQKPSESRSDSSGSEDEWTKQQQQADSPTSSPAAGRGRSEGLQREDWMTVPMEHSQFLQQQQEQKQEEIHQPEEPPVIAGIRYRNPEQAAAAAERAAAREAAAAAGGNRGPISAAAGVSWRLKAVQRAQQLAKEQGKDLDEVLTERWGSAAETAKGLIDGAAAAAVAAEQVGTRQSSSSQHAPRNRGLAPQYLADVRVRSEQATMKRPASDGSRNRLSWRQADERRGASTHSAEQEKDAAHADKSHSRSADRDSRQLEHSRGRHDSRASDRDRDRDVRRDPRAVDSDGPRSREEQPREHIGGHHMQGDRCRGGEASRRRVSPDRDRDKQHKPVHHRARQHNGNRVGERSERGSREVHEGVQQQQHNDRSDHRGTRTANADDRMHLEQQQQQQQKAEVVEALKAVAGHINTFSNDGTFMQQFTGQQQQQDEQQQPAESGSRVVGDEQQEQQELGARSNLDVPAAAAHAAGSNRSRAELLRARLAGKSTTATLGVADQPAGAAAGNRSTADALRAKLSGKPAAAGEAVAGSDSSRAAEVVQLPLIDASGCAAPGAFGRETAAEARRQQEAAAGGRLAKRVQRYGAEGQRERYFADDDNLDLQTLVKRAKHGDDSLDIDRTLASNIAARSRFKETDLDADAEYDYDAGLDLSESRRKRGDVQQQRERERQRQIAQFRRSQRLEDNCSYCFSSPVRPKELAIAVGQATYLSLVQRGRLVEGHCCIVPAEHVASTRQVDDNTWTEIRNFQKCLIRMFMEAGKEVMFLETATALGTHRNHAIMECIPVDQGAFAKAPLYFKKALQEAESEWSQHASKSVIDTKVKGLRGSIPPNFPYMYVQFGYANGFVHVIDDESKFDKNLGRQVMVGLLKLPAEVMHRKQKTEAHQVQVNAAAAFRKQFAPFDWTKALD